MSKTIYTKKYKDFIVKLKQARLDKGLEQVDVAKLIGKSQSYISKIESGQIRLDIIQTQELAKIYNKDILYFLK